MIDLIKTVGFAKFKEFMPTQTVTGFPISVLSFDRQVDVVMKWARSRLSRVVCVSNVHMLMEGHWNKEFADVLMKADLLTPDGMPLVWMTGLMKGRPQDRVAGMELMLALCSRAETMGVSLFLLGSTDRVLIQIQARLAKEFPKLQITGVLSPPFRQLSEKEDEAIAAQINESGAGLVFVSLGCPKQERWMSDHRERISAVMVGLGGVFEVYAGSKQWAPSWMRRHGLEWCYRLKQDPRRLWKRYASTIPPFVWLAFKQIVKVQLGLDPDRSLRQRVRNS
ncbi:MAG: WecB/TagA/CpsF family glycosyltransferase [Phormidesmis sp.]